MTSNIDLGSILLESLKTSVPVVFKSTWLLWAIILLFLFVKISYLFYQRRRLSKAGMNQIDVMDGKTFEDYLADLFQRMGYSVKQVGSFAGDYGADLIITKGGIITAVQAKRHKGLIGVDAVREVLGSIKMYKCNNGLVVTNSFFTKQAKKLAYSNNIELWDRNVLTDRILNVKKETKKLD